MHYCAKICCLKHSAVSFYELIYALSLIGGCTRQLNAQEEMLSAAIGLVLLTAHVHVIVSECSISTFCPADSGRDGVLSSLFFQHFKPSALVVQLSGQLAL